MKVYVIPPPTSKDEPILLPSVWTQVSQVVIDGQVHHIVESDVGHRYVHLAPVLIGHPRVAYPAALVGDVLFVTADLPSDYHAAVYEVLSMAARSPQASSHPVLTGLGPR